MNTKKIKNVYLKTVDRNKNACTNVQGNKYNEFVHYEIVGNRDHFNQHGYSSIRDSLQSEYYSNIPNGISIRKKYVEIITNDELCTELAAMCLCVHNLDIEHRRHINAPPITKTRLFKYTENFATKQCKFSDKSLIWTRPF